MWTLAPRRSSTKTNVTLDWYDYLFKNVANGLRIRAGKIFVMGTTSGVKRKTGLSPGARNTKYFYIPREKANSLLGDGQSFRRQFPFRATGSVHL